MYDADTDDGGVNDGDEVTNGTDPLDPSDDVAGNDDLEGGYVGGACDGCSRTSGGPSGAFWMFAGLFGLLMRRR